MIPELFDDFLGRVNDISEATGASDFESEVIPLLQREIPGLRVYEIEEDEEDDEEPSLDDFRDVEGKLSSENYSVKFELVDSNQLGRPRVIGVGRSVTVYRVVIFMNS